VGNPIELQIYITSGTSNSEQALNQLRIALDKKALDRYCLEIIDLKQEPLRGLIDGIVAIPTLQRKNGLQTHRLIGNLSDQAVLDSFLSF
jgi:circadian clock protein KaiB